jgi:hypothetical protein
MFEKLKSIYPSLTSADFDPVTGTIRLQNDSDGKGDYIKFWGHPSLTQPTQAQLDGVK